MSYDVIPVAYTSQIIINEAKLGPSMRCDVTPNNPTLAHTVADIE